MDAQEKNIFLVLLLIALFIGSIIYYFFASLQRQHKKILELKRKNMTAELDSIEKDRARIASDLHDELSPMLSAVKLKVSSFDVTDPEDQRQQQKTDEHLDDVLQRLRSISFNLMPVTLQRKGLRAALQEFTGYLSHGDLQIELVAEDVPLTEAQSIHLYRIVQEVVHNTVKHAGASLLRIDLKTEGGFAWLLAKENGRGFNYKEKLTEGTGFGLRNLLSRTDVLGGELTIESGKGGTQYTLQIPLTEPR